MRRRIVQHGASFLGILGCNTCLEWVWNQDTDLVLATILLGLKYLNDLQAYTTLQTHCIIQKKMHGSNCEGKFFIQDRLWAEIFEQVWESALGYLARLWKEDSSAPCGFSFFFFFKSSDCIQLRLFQGLGGLNEAEGREWARKKKGRLRDGGGRMCWGVWRLCKEW